MSDSEDESRDKTIKLVIIGDGSSGKVFAMKQLNLFRQPEYGINFAKHIFFYRSDFARHRSI